MNFSAVRVNLRNLVIFLISVALVVFFISIGAVMIVIFLAFLAGFILYQRFIRPLFRSKDSADFHEEAQSHTTTHTRVIEAEYRVVEEETKT